MPKELTRKRGKRRPKTDGSEVFLAPEVGRDVAQVQDEEQPVDEGVNGGPSGIHPSRAALLQGNYVPPAAGTHQHSRAEENQEGGEESGDSGWARVPPVDPDFPFGILDPDVQAYFRNVEDQIRDWEGTSSTGEEREGESSSYFRPTCPNGCAFSHN